MTWRERIRAAQDGVGNAYLNRAKVFAEAIGAGFTYEEVGEAAGGMTKSNVHKIVNTTGFKKPPVALDDPFVEDAG